MDRKKKTSVFLTSLTDTMNKQMSFENKRLCNFLLIGWAVSIIASIALAYYTTSTGKMLSGQTFSFWEAAKIIGTYTLLLVSVLSLVAFSIPFLGRVFVGLVMGIIDGFRAIKKNKTANSSLSESSESEPTPSEHNAVVETPSYAGRESSDSDSLSVCFSPVFNTLFLEDFHKTNKYCHGGKSPYTMLVEVLNSREWCKFDLERVGYLLYHINVVDFNKLGYHSYSKWIKTFFKELGREDKPLADSSKIKNLFESEAVAFHIAFDFVYKQYVELHPDYKGPVRFHKKAPTKTQ